MYFSTVLCSADESGGSLQQYTSTLGAKVMVIHQPFHRSGRIKKLLLNVNSTFTNTIKVGIFTFTASSEGTARDVQSLTVNSGSGLRVQVLSTPMLVTKGEMLVVEGAAVQAAWSAGHVGEGNVVKELSSATLTTSAIHAVTHTYAGNVAVRAVMEGG